MPSPVPIALFAYARPAHLSRTLEGLRKNRVPLIYVFSDGPKSPVKEPTVHQVREILHQVDWCEVKLIERAQNLGLGTSIRMGVSQVLELHDQVIVVEDDIVFRPGAYQYVVAALAQYENTPSVMTISMWSHPRLVPSQPGEGFFSRRFICWGWATSRLAWAKYLGTPAEICRKCEQEGIKVSDWGNDLKWQAEHAAEKNLWYVGYALTHLLYGGVSFFPRESLTLNIGFDGSGENTGTQRIQDVRLADQAIQMPQAWPSVHVPPSLEKQFAAYFSLRRPSFLQRMRNYGGKQKRRLLRLAQGTW